MGGEYNLRTGGYIGSYEPGAEEERELAGLEKREATVFALCHEVGNLVAAIRLNAHLIDEESSGLELATASVEIDDCSTRIRSLLALVRPLLAESPASASGLSPDALVQGVADALDEYGGRGVSIEVQSPGGLPSVPGRLETLHHLVATLAYHAVEEARPRGRVGIRAHRGDGGVVFSIQDDGPQEEGLGDAHEGPPTGRFLACEVAEIVLGSLGGGVEVRRVADATEILLTLPALE